MNPVKLLAFAASNSRHSINRALVDHSLHRLRDEFISDLSVTLLDLNDFEMPLYSIDREMGSGIPTAARDFFDKIGSSDAVMVSFAEHNGTVTAAWKNIFDWMSRIDSKVWQGKSLVLMAATPGPRAGAGVLQYASLAGHFGAKVIGSIGIGNWSESYDSRTCSLVNPSDVEALKDVLSKIAEECQ